MRKALYNLTLFTMVLALIGCGKSTEEIEADVKLDMTTELQKRADEADITLVVESFDLLHKEGKEYSGILKTVEDGTEYTYQVDVTVDGDNYMWKIVE